MFDWLLRLPHRSSPKNERIEAAFQNTAAGSCDRLEMPLASQENHMLKHSKIDLQNICHGPFWLDWIGHGWRFNSELKTPSSELWTPKCQTPKCQTLKKPTKPWSDFAKWNFHALGDGSELPQNLGVIWQVQFPHLGGMGQNSSKTLVQSLPKAGWEPASVYTVTCGRCCSQNT